MGERWARLSAPLFASLLFASASYAQSGLGHVDDPSTAPRGLLRLRAITAWTRYDDVFTANGVEPLGAFLTADSLGARQVPALASIESLVQSASGSSFALTLGRSRLNATAREEVIPIGLEYGVTDRFSVTLVTPIVRKRVATLFRLDTAGSAANVGPNPHRTSAIASQNNTQVQAEFASAANQLQGRLQSCGTDPSGAGCSTLLARQAEAMQLIQSSQSFASQLAALYGSAAGSGMAFVPISLSSAQIAIGQRVAAFNAQYRDLLATSATLIQAVPFAAGGPAGPADLQRYVIEDLGADSLNSQERVGIGDMEVGFRFRLLDRPRAERQRTGLQFTVASSVRLPTGSTQSTSEIADLRIGDGSVVVDSRALLDARAGRLGLFAAGQFATSVHDKDTTNLATRNSRWTEIQVAPRWHLSEALALHAAYSLRSTDKLGSDQLLGGGVSYSTLSAYRGGGRSLPMEMRFTHLEAVTGAVNRPKFFRDQIEVRIYFRLH